MATRERGIKGSRDRGIKIRTATDMERALMAWSLIGICAEPVPTLLGASRLRVHGGMGRQRRGQACLVKREAE